MPTALVGRRENFRVDGLDHPGLAQLGEKPGPLEGTEAREIDDAAHGEATVDQQEDLLRQRQLLRGIFPRRLAVALEASDPLKHRGIAGHRFVHRPPLVHHAQTVHQDLLGGEQLRGFPNQGDLSRL